MESFKIYTTIVWYNESYVSISQHFSLSYFMYLPLPNPTNKHAHARSHAVMCLEYFNANPEYSPHHAVTPGPGSTHLLDII